MILASDDGSARLCDAASGKLGKPMKHVSAVASAAFSKDGQRVVTVIGGSGWSGAMVTIGLGPPNREAQVWDAASGKPLGEPMNTIKPVKAAAFNSDGERVVTVTGGEMAVGVMFNNWAGAVGRNAQVWDAALASHWATTQA